MLRLRSIGAAADGAVGDPNPLKAIEEVRAGRSFDEIVLSALPAGKSGWLAWDLPRRLRRRTESRSPVITIRQDMSERSAT